MDSQTVKKNLQPFVELGRQEGWPFEIMKLDDAIPGLPDDNYIVHIVAPWAAGQSFDQTMDQLLELLWRSTSAEERRGIAMLRVSPDRNGQSARYVGESLTMSADK